MLHEETVPPTMTLVLAMGPKLLVKSAVERNLAAKARKDYTSGEVGQLCAAAIHVIMRSGVEHEQVGEVLGDLHFGRCFEGVGVPAAGAHLRRAFRLLTFCESFFSFTTGITS